MSERQASTYRKSDYTNAHLAVLEILSQNKVLYRAEEWIAAFGHFNHKGRPVCYRVDVLVNDPNFGAGVIEIDGLAHNKESQAIKDMRKDERLKALGLWIERVPNPEAHRVMEYLEKHRAKLDAYGGRS